MKFNSGSSIKNNAYSASSASVDTNEKLKKLNDAWEIALKESNETSYWLKLMHETKRIDTTAYQYAEKLCGNIRRLLIASCKTAKENAKLQQR